MGIPHVTGSAVPRDCSSTVPHGKCVLLFRPERLLGSRRLAAPGTAVPRAGAKPRWPLTHFPALGRVSSLSCVRSLHWLCLKPHRSLRVTREVNQQRGELEPKQNSTAMALHPQRGYLSETVSVSWV